MVLECCFKHGFANTVRILCKVGSTRSAGQNRSPTRIDLLVESTQATANDSVAGGCWLKLRVSRVHIAEFFVLSVKYSSTVLLLVFFWGLVSTPHGTSIAASPDEATQTVFKEYCSACHSGAKPEGGFDVASLTSETMRK